MNAGIGLALSGGGVRGIAHIGVLRALAEHGIEADIVSGSSSGAIVGALYAAGYSPEKMVEFFKTKHPFHLSKLSLGKPGLIDTKKVEAEFLEYFPEDSFEALGKPLIVTATDIINGRLVTFESGPLILPIIASCSVPMLFTPTKIDGRWYVDGGILSNFPVEVLEGRCSSIVGVFASPLEEIEQSDLKTSFAVTRRALEVGMYSHSRAKFGHCDLLLCPPDLTRFSIFDTRHVDEIADLGYDAAVKSLPAIERLARAATTR